jgi:hypothetical protein
LLYRSESAQGDILNDCHWLGWFLKIRSIDKKVGVTAQKPVEQKGRMHYGSSRRPKEQPHQFAVVEEHCLPTEN